MSPTPNLLHLPTELLASISSVLPNRDIKSLRLTCRLLFSIAHLRLSRVFLSANPRNIAVFRAIADHEAFRKEIVEVIWDDARLDIPEDEDTFYPEECWGAEEFGALCYEYSEGDCPRWFWQACEDNIATVRQRKGQDVVRPDHVARDRLIAERLPLKDSWAYYRELLRQQREVLDAGADVDAFRYGLERFISLKRVTITPFAHGHLFTPRYETPMIRAFPPGFNYLIPRTWYVNCAEMGPGQRRWDQLNEAGKDQWRAVRIAFRELAQADNHAVSELVIDVSHLLSGFNCTVFTEPCPEYNNLVSLIRRPGFRRLDLALAVDRQPYEENWSAFRSGYLKRALAGAVDMEHFSLRTDEREANPTGDVSKHFIPLRDIFPVEKWPRLRHFGLSRFQVRQADLISLLVALPATVQSVELSCLAFLDGNYRDLLTGMRETLGWHRRSIDKRPRVIVGIPTLFIDDRIIWVSEEVEAFLYRDRPNPFEDLGGESVPYGVGIMQDAFDPKYERPNLDLAGLADNGYIEHAYFNGCKIY